MKISSEILPYLAGEKFDDSLSFQIERAETPPDRIEFVENIIRGKSVIHIGCLDHVPLIQYRVQQGRWLHARITDAASECLGIDINQEGIEFVRSQMNISNIYYGDLESVEKITAISDRTWDYAVFGEVIEHLDNPVLFLQKFISNYGSQIGGIIITVPNALRATNIRLLFKGLEVINSDHRFWFTPYTLLKVIDRSGLVTEQLQMCKFDYSSQGIREKIRDFVLKRYPLLAEDIVIVCHQVLG
jgi:Methyltransferase domain